MKEKWAIRESLIVLRQDAVNRGMGQLDEMYATSIVKLGSEVIMEGQERLNKREKFGGEHA